MTSGPIMLRGVKPQYKLEAHLRLCGTYFSALPGLHSRRGARPLENVETFAVLEALALTTSTTAAFKAYVTHTKAPFTTDTWSSWLPRAPWNHECLHVAGGNITFTARGDTVDLTQPAKDGANILVNLVAREHQGRYQLEPSAKVFLAGLDQLTRLGLVSPPTGGVDWGDLSRIEPFCERYGGSRGTIIDRYYLSQFVHAVRHEVVGRTVEVGTSLLTPDNRLSCSFPGVETYQTLDVMPGPHVDICGDITHRGTLLPGSVDSIICFNVLEHCADVQTVVDNMLVWLAPRGRVFCMVPSVQRLHDAPSDYWRPMPGGLQHLFRRFSDSRLHIYGNLQTTIAALTAQAVEDLNPKVLDFHHPDYPVATCIVATK